MKQMEETDLWELSEEARRVEFCTAALKTALGGGSPLISPYDGCSGGLSRSPAPAHVRVREHESEPPPGSSGRTRAPPGVSSAFSRIFMLALANRGR